MYPELQYVEIIATTGSSGSDQNVQERGNGEEEELASTITVLASPEQSRLLAELEQTGKLHAALVFRGESTQAQKFLDEQASVLKELYPEETEDPKRIVMSQEAQTTLENGQTQNWNRQEMR